MIHVTIALVPHGHEEGRKTISELFIANVGNQEDGKTQYHIWIKDPRFPANPKKPNAKCRHVRSHGINKLVAIAFESLDDA